jgi:hypothetical protein
VTDQKTSENSTLKHSPQEQEAYSEETPDNARSIGIGFIAGVIVSVLALEFYGFLKHPSENDRATIDEFSLLAISPEHEIKVSPKASGKVGFCLDGYLLLRPENGKQVAGILVDGKNRPITCKPQLGTL